MSRLLRIAFWAAALFAFVMATLPAPPNLPVSDKLQHMTAFFVIALLGCAAFPRLSRFKLLLALIAFTSATFSYGMSLRLNNPGVLGQVINNVAQPLMLLSGTLLPIALAPGWLRAIADANPFSWSVTAMRALFHGHAGDSSIWHSLTMMLALAVLALAWSARQFARSVR